MCEQVVVIGSVVSQGVILLLVNKPKKVCNPKNNNSFETTTLGYFNLKNNKNSNHSHINIKDWWGS